MLEFLDKSALSSEEMRGKTLMQTAVELDKPQFVKALLKKWVDPNVTGQVSSSECSCYT